MFKGFICLHLLLFFLMIIFLCNKFFSLSILNQHCEPEIEIIIIDPTWFI